MALAHFQRAFTDTAGNVRAGLSVTVRDESNGALAALFSDKAGTVPLANPLTTDEFGEVNFYAAVGDYRLVATGVDYRDVAVLTAASLQDAVEDAEEAAQVAALNAGIYDDTTAGLAATVDGDYFSVPAAGSDEYLELYRNDTGSATLIDSYPNKAAVDAVDAAVDERVQFVSTLSDLKSIDTSALLGGEGFRITTTGRAGDFTWVAGDQSANVASDPQEGVWVAPDGEDGSDGAWSREYTGPVLTEWFHDGGAFDFGSVVRSIIDAGHRDIRGTLPSYSATSRVDNIPSYTTIDLGGAELAWEGTGLGTLDDAIFLGHGAETGTSASVATTTRSYGQEIELDSNPFSVGDYVRVIPDGSPLTSTYARYVFRVDAVSGNFIHSSYPLLLALYNDGTAVEKIEPIVGSSIINVKMSASGQTSSDGIGAIIFKYAVDCGAKNTEATGFWFKRFKSTMCVGSYDVGGRTFEPAATGGGEGYGTQFEYSYLSGAADCRSHKARHCIDFTASGYCHARDCYSQNGMGAGFLTHKAEEYQISLYNCHSFGDASGFAMGSVNTNFADSSSDIRMEGCSAIEFTDYGLQYTQKGGRGLTVNGFKARPRNPDTFIGDSVSVSNADVTMAGIDCHGKVRVYGDATLANDGYVTIHGIKVKDLPSNRSLSCINNGVVSVHGGEIIGRLEILTNGKVELHGVDHTAEDDAPFVTDDTGSIRYGGGSLTFGPSSTSYTTPARLFLDSCAVSRISSGAALLSDGGFLWASGNCEDLRVTGVNAGEIKFDGARALGRLTLSSFTGRLIVTDSFIRDGIDDLASGGYFASISSFETDSKLDVGNASSGHIVDNASGTSTLPTATSTLIVRDNITL